MSSTPIDPNSLPARAHALLARTKAEYSTMELAEQFNVHPKQITEQLTPLVPLGHLRRDVDGAKIVWAVGAKPLELAAVNGTPAAAVLPPPAVSTKRRRGPHMTPLNVDSLSVQSYDSVPTVRSTQKNYDAALDKLKPGQMLTLDRGYHGGMNGALRDRHLKTRQRYCTRKLSDTEFGVYRLPDATAPLTPKPRPAKPATTKKAAKK